MRFANSRQTLVANFAQQGSAASTLLILPNVLSKSAFAETVYVAVLLSFIAMADLGLNFVYSRIVPAMAMRGEIEAISNWDRTVHSFGLLASLLFASAVSISYFVKFHYLLNALLLLPVAPLTFLASFHVSRITSLGDFLAYRRVAVLRALLAIGVLPLAYLWGVSGWFVGTLLAATMLLAYVRKISWISYLAIDWKLVYRHIGEGVQRCVIAVLWVQLMNVGRLYASTHYTHSDIAEYGIAASAYQSLAALVIAVFLPVSVETLRRFGHSTEDAMKYVHNVAERIAPWSLLGAIVVAELSPTIFRWVFPAYHLDSVILTTLLFGVITYPFSIIWGNCLVGARRLLTYMALILFGLAIAWLVAIYFGSDKRGAAIGQFIGLLGYSLAMYLIAPLALKTPLKIWFRAMLVFIVTIGLGVAYWIIRWM